MPLIQCKQCSSSINVDPGTDPHTLSWCNCCTEDHHHGEAAAACPQAHEGPCWNPPTVPVQPDGCTVCRPVIHFANANVLFEGPPGG